MSKAMQKKARTTVQSMGDFASACRQVGMSAKTIVINALQTGQEVGPYARAALAIAQYDAPDAKNVRSRPGHSSGF